MKSFTIIAAVASVAVAQNLGSCAQLCADNMARIANTEFSCGAGDVGCFCSKSNWAYGIRDCSAQACGAEEAGQAVSWATNQCLGVAPSGSVPAALPILTTALSGAVSSATESLASGASSAASSLQSGASSIAASVSSALESAQSSASSALESATNSIQSEASSRIASATGAAGSAASSATQAAGAAKMTGLPIAGVAGLAAWLLI